MITLENICKRYGDTQVLKDVNLTLKKGQRVCIMGPSGVGKTTLVQILMGLVTPDSGRIRGAENVRFACTFQEDRLVPQLTAAANVRFACGKQDETAMASVFAKVGFTAEDLAKPVAQLSGGQRRRVALCRALLADSSVLVLDEPFKGLDEATKAQTVQAIHAALNGRTLVCVTHDESDIAALQATVFVLV